MKHTKLALLGFAVLSAWGTQATMAQVSNWAEPDPDPGNYWTAPADPTPQSTPENLYPVTVPSVSPTVPDTGETQITIGLAPKVPSGRIQGIDLSTSEIDTYLRTAAPAYLNFGNHYTRNLANKGFEDLRELEAKLEVNGAKDLVAGIEDLKAVYNFDVDINPFQLQLGQKGTALTGRIGNFSAYLVGKFKADICGTILGSVELENITAYSELDLYTGNVQNTQGSVRLVDVEVASFNPLKFICIAIGDIIIDKNKMVRESLFEAITDASFVANSQKIFGLSNLLDGIEVYVNDVGNIPVIGFDARVKAKSAIDKTRALLENPNFQGSGVQIDFLLGDDQHNRLSLVASHNPTQIQHLEYTPNAILMSLILGENTERVDIYAQFPGGTTWSKVGSTTRSFAAIPAFQKGTLLTTISRSRTFGDLYSLPGRFSKTTWDYTCHLYGGGSGCKEFY